MERSHSEGRMENDKREREGMNLSISLSSHSRDCFQSSLTSLLFPRGQRTFIREKCKNVIED